MAERRQKQLFLGRDTFLFYYWDTDIISALFFFFFPNESPSSYNAILFDNRNSFTGEEIQYTTFASWVDTIIDKLHVRDRGKLLL